MGLQPVTIEDKPSTYFNIQNVRYVRFGLSTTFEILEYLNVYKACGIQAVSLFHNYIFANAKTVLNKLSMDFHQLFLRILKKNYK